MAVLIRMFATHQYLNFKSWRPPHVKKGIPYSQALRLRRIYDSDYIFKIRVEQLKGFLIKRGYKEDLIDSQVGRVFNLDRSNVLEYSLKKDYVDRWFFL